MANTAKCLSKLLYSLTGFWLSPPCNLRLLNIDSILCALQMLKHKISLLEASNAELQRELQERRTSCEHLSQRALDAQVVFFE